MSSLNKWVFKNLSDVFDTTSGGTPSRKNSKYYSGNIPWLKSGELKDNIIKTTEEAITEEAIKNSSSKIFPKGTLLIALYGATVGRLGILEIDSATNQAVCAIFVKENFSTKFYYYFLLSIRKSLLEKRIGGAQPNISQKIIREITIPIPPTNEQIRIVEKIEELLTKLAATVTELKNVKKQLKRYRQSVLKSAFEGKLTEQWREENNLKMNSWKILKLSDIGEVISGGTPSTNITEYFNGEIPWITPADLTGYSQKYISRGKRNISISGLSNSSAKILPKNSFCFHQELQLDML